MVKGGIFLGDRYEVLSKIGAGGMADVYKGKDTMLNRFVAIKVLKREYREDENFVKKFKSEAQAAAGLLSPNIVNVYDVGEDRGLYYMVMELVEGITLKDYVEKKGMLSAKEAISISIQICAGIEAAHKHHIIHRDIKPQNIIISKEGRVKVTDFGIARAATSNTISSNAMGSVHYTSPEQARGGFSDGKSDIYSLGITMYEMVTGRVPFDGDSTVSIAMKHLQEEIIPPSEYVPNIPYSLEQIILKCCRKSPDKRYPNITLLTNDLKRSLIEPAGNKEDDYEIEDDEDNYDEEDGHEDDRYTDDSDDYRRRNREGRDKIEEVNPKMNRLIRILMVVVAVIILFIAVFIIGQATGLFRFPSGNTPKISEDEKLVEVPNLLGEKEAIARKMLEQKNLGMKVVGTKPSTYPEGTIAEQSVPGGDEVPEKTEIEVYISSEAEGEEVPIPDVSGMDEDGAQRTLKQAGFTNVVPESEYDDTQPQGRVFETVPPANTKVKKDTQIKMRVSKGSEKVAVPDVRGKTASQASSLITSAGLNDSGGTQDYSETVPQGQIISQNPVAGQRVSKGSSVSYVVSLGKRPEQKVAVPTLVGLNVADAMHALTTVGLRYTQTTVASNQPVGTVVSTNPTVGTEVAPNSTVTLQISEGPPDPPPTPEIPDPPPPDPSTGEQP